MVDGAEHVCLAEKIREVGRGRLNFYGSRQEEKEALFNCALRGTQDKSGGRNGFNKGVIIDHAKTSMVGYITFYLGPNNCAWWSTYVFKCTSFRGEPESTNEMQNPTWFKVSALPYSRMQGGDVLFLKPILEEKQRVQGHIHYIDEDTVLVAKHSIEVIRTTST